MINSRFKNNVKNAKTYPGADINSDHNPVVVKLYIKLKNTRRKSSRDPQIDISALQQPEIRHRFVMKVKNKFDCLSTESIEQYRRETPMDKINAKWDCLKTSILTANTILPIQGFKKKQAWMTEDIFNKMAERRKAKNTPEYNDLNKKVRQLCRAAKEEWISKQCKDIENMAMKHQHKNMHKQILQLSNKRKSMPGGGCLKNKKGDIIMDNDEIIHRCCRAISRQ
jgi:hypothetical protein